MRYLYGDSVPFPLQYNVLQTLEVFVASAAHALELDAHARALESQTSEMAATRVRNVEGLERFHQAVMRSLRDTSSRTMEGLMVEYARQVSDQAQHIVDGARAVASQANDREAAAARVEIDRNRTEIRAALEAFFKVARLPLLEARLSATLPVAKEPQYEMSGVLSLADGIVVSYTINAESMSDWSHPRRVAEFAQGVNLLVGAKKSWFKKTVQQELVNLDDHYISGFDLSEDSAVMRMRRRPELPDSYVFSLKRVDTSLIADVHHPDDPDADGQLPTAVEASDRMHLERLWQILRKSAMPALEHRARIVSVHLDGDEVFASGKVAELVTRIVKMIGPTVSEIARRSPNAEELSLKIEHDGGRREEIYLKKADLVSKVLALGPQEQAVFAPLPLGQANAPAPLPPE